MYYAIHHQYGNRTYSLGDTLHRYCTKAERDREVNDEPWDGGYCWETVTRAEARELFPRAFMSLDWTNSDTCSEIWEGDTWGACPTGGEYRYM